MPGVARSHGCADVPIRRVKTKCSQVRHGKSQFSVAMAGTICRQRSFLSTRYFDLSKGATYRSAMAKSIKPLKTSLWRPAQPFNQLPTLPPSAELETKAVLKQCNRPALRWQS